jgi:hypothetical protein
MTVVAHETVFGREPHGIPASPAESPPNRTPCGRPSAVEVLEDEAETIQMPPWTRRSEPRQERGTQVQARQAVTIGLEPRTRWKSVTFQLPA